MKLLEIVNTYETITEIKRTNDLKFSIAWQIGDLLEQLEKHYKRYSDERAIIIKKFGEKESGESYKIPPENFNNYESEMLSLLEFEIDLKDIKKIDYELLEDSNIVVPKTVNLYFLKPFINIKNK